MFAYTRLQGGGGVGAGVDPNHTTAKKSGTLPTSNNSMRLYFIVAALVQRGYGLRDTFLVL
jgi:hypothetical protein